MADLIVVYWRDIPAQVIVKKGRQNAKRELPLRFTEAIDMAAMRSGAAETDAYLAEWRKGDPLPVSDDLEAEADKAMADISVTPGRAGPVTIAVSLLDGEFGPLAAKELRLALSRPEAGIEPIERQAIKQADGSWRVGDLTLPVAGRWTIELEILVSDFEMTRLKDMLDIRP